MEGGEGVSFNEELHGKMRLTCSSDGGNKNACIILVRIAFGRKPLERSMRGWQDNVKIILMKRYGKQVKPLVMIAAACILTVI